MFGGQTGPWLDPWVVLGAVGIRTASLRVGTMITPVPRRRPVKLAKELVTLDHLTGGRLVVGVGLGEPADDEYAAFGEDPDPRRRAARLDEGLAVIDRCLRGGRVDHDGEHVTVHTDFEPGAVQRPRPPVWVAGTWPRPGPLDRACRWDGYVPIGPDATTLSADDIREVVRVLRERGAGHLEVVATVRPDLPAQALVDAGATWTLTSGWPGPGWEDALEAVIATGPPDA